MLSAEWSDGVRLGPIGSDGVISHTDNCCDLTVAQIADTPQIILNLKRHVRRSPFSHLSHPNLNPNSYPNLTLTINLTPT